MRNNKGFTLMELLAAIFIGGMVTAALVLVWKTASTQTSQGQRQTIIRNQVSTFERQLYKDFYSSDIITFPLPSTVSNPTLILVGLKKAKRVSNTSFTIFQSAPQGPTTYYAYCLDTVNSVSVVKRREGIITGNSTTTKNLSDYGENLLNWCRGGSTVLSDFTLVSATMTDEGTGGNYNGEYNLIGSVRKVFKDVQNSTPIYIEIHETLKSQGGI